MAGMPRRAYARGLRAAAIRARSLAASAALLAWTVLRAGAAPTPEEAAQTAALRDAIPLGGNFEPNPEEGVFVAAGHGLRVMASRDDGRTWRQVFHGGPGSDHGPWAVWNSVAYTEGVFAIAAGWGAPGTIVASDDAVHWRHLAGGDRKPGRTGKPYDMGTTMQLIGVRGTILMPLCATPDFGKTWFEKSPYSFTNSAGEKAKVNLAHPSLAYCDFGGGRVIVVGDEGPAIRSDDLGKTWAPMNVAVPWEGDGAKGIIGKGDVFVLLKGTGETVLRSADGGATWTSHPLGVARPLSRSFAMSVVGDEFWITGKNAKASKDGITWRDLPASTPAGRVARSDAGTLISVDRARLSILRSEDGVAWQEVHKLEAGDGSKGALGMAGVAFGRVKRAGP